MDNSNQDLRRSFNNYLLNNQVSLKNDEAVNHIHNVMYGGNDCKCNNSIFKWTMQSLNKNQRTISGDKLMGGRVSLPSNYFNPSASFPSPSSKNTIMMGDVTPALVRPGLNSTFKVGGKNVVVSKKQFASMLKKNGGSNMKLSNKEVNELYTGYNKNLNSFMNHLDSFKIGGRSVSKNTINRAFSALKNN